MTVEMQYVQSSSVEQIGYDEVNEELYVRFLNSNITYVYSGVPEYVYSELQSAGSHGEYHNQHIKNVYPFRKE